MVIKFKNIYLKINSFLEEKIIHYERKFMVKVINILCSFIADNITSLLNYEKKKQTKIIYQNMMRFKSKLIECFLSALINDLIYNNSLVYQEEKRVNEVSVNQ